MKTEIPIFFSTDDNYIPYLDVAVSSLIENASKDYQYRIVVLNTGLRAENVAKVKSDSQLVITLINCIINREILDISYFFIMLQYFIRIMKIRLSDVDEEL